MVEKETLIQAGVTVLSHPVFQAMNFVLGGAQ